MSETRWQSCDDYLYQQLVGADEALEAALADSHAAGLPAIAVSPLQGKFLHILTRLVGARRVLEVGTLGGYSAIWMARALPADGRLVSLEISPEHAKVARDNLARAGLSDRVEIVLGPALGSLAQLWEDEGPGTFDLSFIDADKPNNPRYWEWALKLTRPGGLIVVDNVVRDGKVADGNSTDAAVLGSRAVLEAMGAAPGVTASALQTVGSKGYDGFALAVVPEGNGPSPGPPAP